ncbi:serpin family protein [Cellulomonas sp. 73-92]|uniref:serpin family protein n=1 Tax=Cellulomonas sp. 73-92 TaxID=1895740 RepID=UPI000B165702|nr:serpin family protein [Cellulomonas sp. 73-92]
MTTIPPGGDRTAHGLQTGSGVRDAVAPGTATAVDPVVAATWRAGFAALAASDPADSPGGAVVSPASLLVALAMLAEGADGASAARLDEVLGAPGQERTDAVNALTAALARYEGDPAAVQAKELPAKPVVHVANQVVVDDGWRITESYLARLVRGYGAGVLVTDLSSAAGKKRTSTPG